MSKLILKTLLREIKHETSELSNMKRVNFTEQERRALDEFVAEYWTKFQKIAEKYLDEAEIESLSDKLKG